SGEVGLVEVARGNSSSDALDAVLIRSPAEVRTEFERGPVDAGFNRWPPPEDEFRDACPNEVQPTLQSGAIAVNGAAAEPRPARADVPRDRPVVECQAEEGQALAGGNWRHSRFEQRTDLLAGRADEAPRK